MAMLKGVLTSAAVAVALTISATQAEAATELITNGSFETGKPNRLDVERHP